MVFDNFFPEYNCFKAVLLQKNSEVGRSVSFGTKNGSQKAEEDKEKKQLAVVVEVVVFVLLKGSGAKGDVALFCCKKRK